MMERGGMDSSKVFSQGLRGQRGQLSIFLGISLFVVISFTAFVVNVGLFVKAKINLQNATDAAAWAGAAVQARQLSNIAYVNYHFRRIYKEWMFKYYILGNLGGLAGHTDFTLSRGVSGGTTNFRAVTTPLAPGKDKYNVPSICLHYDDSGAPSSSSSGDPNICAIAAIPGLPRFEQQNIPNISRMNRQFIDDMVRHKNESCSNRSDLNFTTAMNWAFGSGQGGASAGMPLLVPDRMGAWPSALLTAIRMRNLESIVNTPPMTIIADMAPGGTGRTTISQLRGNISNTSSMPYFERPIKAFLAAWRNLGGGYKKRDGASDPDELSNSLVLTELKPREFQADPAGLSGYLIPANQTYPGPNGISLLQKSYLDLVMMPVNYATFYTHFVPSTGNVGGTPSDGECGMFKVAVPVPSYVMGFAKNYEVMTYYSVKATTRFMGLFFPFFRSLDGGIELNAYASAKPFGGRIGPWTFKPDTPGGSALKARVGPPYRSLHNILGLTSSPFTGVFEPGDVIPSSSYIIHQDDVIGGTPARAGIDPKFAIPNMIYDFKVNLGEIQGGTIFHSLSGNPTSTPTEPKLGLYSWDSYEYFRSSTIGTSPPHIIVKSEIDKYLLNALNPTKYEAANWMLPLKTGGMESPTTAIPPSGLPDDKEYILYAPLRGPGTLYLTPTDITDVVKKYMRETKKAMETFLKGLQDVADEILAQGRSSTAGPESYEEAAATIYPLMGPDGSKTTNPGSYGCASGEDPSMAAKFYHYLKPNENEECEVIPVVKELREYINGIPNPGYLIAEYRRPNPDDSALLSTAYAPGPAHGDECPSGESCFKSPFSPDPPESSKRNYYSTKFIPTERLRDSGKPSPYGQNLYHEGFPGGTFETITDPYMNQGTAIENTLLPGDLNLFEMNSASGRGGELAY